VHQQENISSEFRAECDRVLEYNGNAGRAVHNRRLSVKGIGSLPLYIGQCFSLTAWENCVTAKQTITLNCVSLSEEQWTVLENVKASDFYCHIPAPPSFWRNTAASSVVIGRNADDDALNALGERDEPIPSVLLEVEMSSTLNASHEGAFLASLNGIKNLALSWCEPQIYRRMGYVASPDAWRRFWLSPALHKNESLTELTFVFFRMELWHLEVIRDCMKENWFLQDIKLLLNTLTSEALAYWQANIQPLLALNRSHLPRLEPGEQRLSVLHDALVRLRNHPTKLYNFLLNYPHAWTPIAAQESFGEDLSNEHAVAVAPSYPASQLQVSPRRHRDKRGRFG
jgi:hypothetical protein